MGHGTASPRQVMKVIQAFGSLEGGRFRDNATIVALKAELDSAAPPATYGSVQKRVLRLVVETEATDEEAAQTFRASLARLERNCSPPLTADTAIIKPPPVQPRPAGVSASAKIEGYRFEPGQSLELLVTELDTLSGAVESEIEASTGFPLPDALHVTVESVNGARIGISCVHEPWASLGRAGKLPRCVDGVALIAEPPRTPDGFFPALQQGDTVHVRRQHAWYEAEVQARCRDGDRAAVVTPPTPIPRPPARPPAYRLLLHTRGRSPPPLPLLSLFLSDHPAPQPQSCVVKQSDVAAVFPRQDVRPIWEHPARFREALRDGAAFGGAPWKIAHVKSVTAKPPGGPPKGALYYDIFSREWVRGELPRVLGGSGGGSSSGAGASESPSPSAAATAPRRRRAVAASTPSIS